jgi:hypothetical protein
VDGRLGEHCHSQTVAGAVAVAQQNWRDFWRVLTAGAAKRSFDLAQYGTFRYMPG